MGFDLNQGGCNRQLLGFDTGKWMVPMFGWMQDMMTTGHMTWPMGAGMALLAVVLVLAAIALVKYIAIR